jgi:hypothetical protein
MNPADGGLTWGEEETGYPGLWWTPYTDGVVSRVTQDGVEYTEAYSLQEADDNAEYFYYDLANQKLYLHTTDTDDPGTQTAPPLYDYVVLAYFWRYFANTQYGDALIVLPRIGSALIDGSYERWSDATTPVNWTKGEAGTSIVNREQTEADDGAFCVRLDIDAGNNEASVHQHIRLVPGATCKVIVRYKHAGSATSAIEIKDSADNVYLASDGSWGASPDQIALSNQTEWTTHTLTFVANASYIDYIITFKSDSSASASCYFDKASLIIEREQNPYLPYITTAGMPELHQSVSPFHESAMTMEFGSLQFLNDGWWYEQVQKYYWNLKDVVIRFGAKDFTYDQYEDVFHGLARYPKASDLIVSVDVIDHKAFTYKNVPLTTYEVDNYSELEDGAEGTPIPIIYGEFEEVVATCINASSGIVGGKDPYTFKLACHELEAIVNVWKNGQLLATPADYSVDPANGEFSLVADPGQAFVVAHVKGRKCGILDGAYSENVADILFDLLTTYAGVEFSYIELKSFLDLQSGRSQKHHLYLSTSSPALESVRTLQVSALFHLSPLLNGQLGAFRYYEGTDSNTPVVVDEEIEDFGLEFDTEGVYKTIQINYGLLPSENHYSSVEIVSAKTEWKHGNELTLPLTTSLRLQADAEELGAYYVGVLQDPLKKVTGILPSKIFSSFPGSKVIITKTRLLSDGTVYSVLASEPYRLLDLKKSMQSGKVGVIAWEDLQSSGGGFCEVCYHCQVCNAVQSGTCSSCYACQLCVAGQCSTCQTCYYCQACVSGQCAACQICNTCQSCDTCQTGQCGICVACQICNTGEYCTECEQCNSCQKCYNCQKCYGGVLP